MPRSACSSSRQLRRRHGKRRLAGTLALHGAAEPFGLRLAGTLALHNACDAGGLDLEGECPHEPPLLGALNERMRQDDMIHDATFSAGATEAGTRLDAALTARFPTSTRAFCRQAVEAAQVLVNGRPCLKGSKLRADDTVAVLALKEARDNRVRPDASVPVRLVFEDAQLLAASKPAGMAVHPLTSEETGTLMNGLVARYPELAEVGDQPLMAGALHRIDTGTSGLVLAARTQAAFDALRAQFDAQTVEKVYLALVEGHVAVPGRLTHELAHHPGLAHCKMVDARSLAAPDRRLRAETAYKPLELAGRNTLLEVTIRTGVTHQIRCQLALGGFPIINDTLYGARPVDGCTRHFLHAFEARFTHPAHGQPCCLRAPLTQDFLAFLAKLSKHV